MSFYLINQDPESPVMAIKSSSVDNLELVFKKRECSKWASIITEWFDDKGPFRAVSQRGDELKIRTIAVHDGHSFEKLIAPLISEREIEVLLTTLVNHNCLTEQYKQDLFRELSHHFAIMRLNLLQTQVKELLDRLTRANKVGVVLLHRVGSTEEFPITPESKNNILVSMKQLKQMIEIITKMMAEKVVITKEEVTLFRSFKPSCDIKTEPPLEKDWFLDEPFSEKVALFVRDFDTFLTDSLARSLSAGSARLGLYKHNSDQKLTNPEVKMLRRTCTIL